MKKWDLHIHSFFSDGENSPKEIINLAVESKLSGIAITDHDNFDAYLYILRNKISSVIPIIPAMEITTNFNDQILHLLAYSFDINNKNITQLVEKHKAIIVDTIIRIEEYFIGSNKDISSEDYYTFCNRNKFSKYHKVSIVKYLQAKNVFSGNKKRIKEKFFSPGGRFFDKKKYTDIRTTIDIIKNSEGYAILAHPYEYKIFPDIDELITIGLDGVEVFHYTANENQRKKLKEFAKKRNLIITGGSDFHSSKRHKIGANTVNENEIISMIKL